MKTKELSSVTFFPARFPREGFYSIVPEVKSRVCLVNLTKAVFPSLFAWGIISVAQGTPALMVTKLRYNGMVVINTLSTD